MGEKLPAGIRDPVVHGLGDQRGAEIGDAAHDQRRDLDLAQAVHVLKIPERPGRRELVRAPAAEIGLGAAPLGTGQARRGVRRHGVVAVAAHILGHGFVVGFAAELAGAQGFVNRRLHRRGEHLHAAHALLPPEAAGGVSAGDHEGLDAPGLPLDRVGDLHHPTPGLAQDMAFLQAEMGAKGLQLVEPGLLIPKLRAAVKIGIAAAELIVHDELTPIRVRDPVQDLKVIVRGTRSAVEEDQGRFSVVGFRPDDPVPGLISEEGHEALCNSRHRRGSFQRYGLFV